MEKNMWHNWIYDIQEMEIDEKKIDLVCASKVLGSL